MPEQFNSIENQDSFRAKVIDHISPFNHIIQYNGKYLNAYVWPGSNCDPQIGDNVLVKRFTNAGYNLIISGPNHEDSNILVVGGSHTYHGGDYGDGGLNRFGFQWRKDSGNWKKVYVPNVLSDPTRKINPAEVFTKTLIQKSLIDSNDTYYNIAASQSYYGNYIYTSPAEEDQGFMLQRSDDLGETWTWLNGPYLTLNDIGLDIDGNLWAVSNYKVDSSGEPGGSSYPVSYTNYILKSEDKGSTWIVKFSESGSVPNASVPGPVRIFPHPNDVNTVIVLYSGLDYPNDFYAKVTTNGGSSWNTYGPIISGDQVNWGSFVYDYHWIKDTGRFIIIGFPQYSNHDGEGVWADGPNYSTWTHVDPTLDFQNDDRYQSSEAYRFCLTGDSDGSRIFAVGRWSGGGGFGGKGGPWANLVFVSYDQGKSFKRYLEFTNITDMNIDLVDPTEVIDDITEFNLGSAYDEIEDALYNHVQPLHFFYGTFVAEQWQIIKLCPVIKNLKSATIDITENLIPFSSENLTLSPYRETDYYFGSSEENSIAWNNWGTMLLPY